MSEELRNTTDVDTIFADISTMIYDAKNEVMLRVNTSVITLYWNIGKKLSEEVLQGKKADYGKNIIGDLSERLTAEYGKGFEKSSVFKMVKFYQEFQEFEKVATLSQQLTWSHFVELLPIEDELKRDFSFERTEPMEYSYDNAMSAPLLSEKLTVDEVFKLVVEFEGVKMTVFREG